jgi:hypothetical protein
LPGIVSTLARQRGWTLRVSSDTSVSALSNGNMSLLIDLARAGRLPFDVILSAELFRK